MKRLTKGFGFEDWKAEADEDFPEPERIGDPRSGVTAYERRHGFDRPINIYPLFENALRAARGLRWSSCAIPSSPSPWAFSATSPSRSTTRESTPRSMPPSKNRGPATLMNCSIAAIPGWWNDDAD